MKMVMKKGRPQKACPYSGIWLCCFSLTLSIATDLAVIVDFGKVNEQATKFHLLKIQTRQKFSPLTEHESVPCEWQEGLP